MGKRNLRTLGFEKEKMAARFLKERGYRIIETNFYCKMGEIDIVAMDGEYLCFVEVKYRKNAVKGGALEAVTFSKQKKIVKSALFYLRKKGLEMDRPMRFDVVTIMGDECRVYKNAFDGFDL